VRVRYDDGPGHPVLLPRPVWRSVVEHLATTDGGAREHGAGPLLAGLGVVEVRVPGPAPVDVDVPSDLTGVGEGTGPELAG
jgi:CTP:molybdopterin cytidylyltransferase MocA